MTEFRIHLICVVLSIVFEFGQSTEIQQDLVQSLQQNTVLCNNNGFLQDGQCRCQMGFTGERCQLPSNDFHNVFKHMSSGCLNNGYQPKEGLPCKCPEGFYGFMCEFMTSENLSACVRQPCRNGGICTPTSYGSYACICRNGFYGQNCENMLYRRTYGGFGSLMPFLMFFSLITMCVYCCCFKKNRTFQTSNLFGQRAEPNNQVAFHAGNFNNQNQNPSHIIYMQSNQHPTEAPKNIADMPPSYEDVVKKPQVSTATNNPAP